MNKSHGTKNVGVTAGSMKFWQLEKLCLENAYTVKREGKSYVWKKNATDKKGVCETVIETAEEIKKDIESSKKNFIN